MSTLKPPNSLSVNSIFAASPAVRRKRIWPGQLNERIRMYFGAEYGMEIWSEKGKGTRVTIDPARRSGQHVE